MIDNYDSFTYNLVQYFGELGEEVHVYRNDAISLQQIRRIRPEMIVISPGPGRPDSAGISKELIRELKGIYPILGVCLGHQCIGEVFGGKVLRAKRIMHGKTSPVFHRGRGLFRGLENPFDATRYHSLIVERASLPGCFSITAWTGFGEIMGLRHKHYCIEGIQFHPESVLTEPGKALLKNFTVLARSTRKGDAC